MKAMHIMFFLFIFNLSISVVSATNIYNMNQYENTGNFNFFTENISSEEAAESQSSAIWFNILFEELGILALATLIGIAAGVGDKWFGTGISGKDAWLYTFFIEQFAFKTYTSARIFLSVGSENFGVILIVIVFIIVCGLVFTIGLYQIASQGGWRSFM